MSHKIYSINSKSDYIVDITFFNGEDTMPDASWKNPTLSFLLNVDKEIIRTTENTIIEILIPFFFKYCFKVFQLLVFSTFHLVYKLEAP